MQVPPYDPNFVYDPNHPSNIADRANDPDDGIDYEQIIIETEADFRAGRGMWFDSIDEAMEYVDNFLEERMRYYQEQERAAS